MNLLQVVRPTPGVDPVILFHIAGFPISNTTVFEVVIMALLAFVCFFVIRKFSIVPKKKIQHIFEMTYELMSDFIEQVTGSRYVAERVFPLSASIIIFLLISNSIGLIPGLTSITYEGNQLFRTPTADINTTLGLAIASMIIIHVASMRDWGFWGYIGNFIRIKHVFLSFRKGMKSGLLSLVDLFIGLLDIIGELGKIISLSLRLFGNMYAGEVLMTILVGLVAYGVPALWLGMSILSALVQAIVFAALVSVFYALAVRSEPKAQTSTQAETLG